MDPDQKPADLELHCSKKQDMTFAKYYCMYTGHLLGQI